MTSHEMTLSQSYPDPDCQEWACPVCGRSLLLYLDPFYLDVLIPGDETASHQGSTLDADLRLNVRVAPAKRSGAVPSPDDRLDAFREFLERLP